MPNSIITYPRHPNLPLLNRILHSPPTHTPRLPPPIRTMQQKQIHIPQPAHLNRLPNRPPHSLIRGTIAAQLSRVEDILTLQPEGILGAAEEAADGLAGFLLVAVHLRAVEGAVAEKEGGVDGGGGFAAGHAVEAELDLGDGEAV